jgi:hypothetical protein
MVDLHQLGGAAPLPRRQHRQRCRMSIIDIYRFSGNCVARSSLVGMNVNLKSQLEATRSQGGVAGWWSGSPGGHWLRPDSSPGKCDFSAAFRRHALPRPL